ncbi:MAG: serpin family protein [Saccharofermentanales bacterium]|jgi:serpin B
MPRFWISLTVILVAAFMLTGCSSGAHAYKTGPLILVTDRPKPLAPLSAAEAERVTAEYSKIASDIVPFADVITDARSGENYIYSPISTWICYAFLAGGLRDEAQSSLEAQLESVTPLNPQLKGRAIAERIEKINDADGALMLKNFLFVNQHYTVKDRFLDVADAFRASIFLMDLEQNDQVTDRINRMIEEATHELIQDFYGQPIDPDVTSILINILAMDAQWEQPFRKNNTMDRPFYLRDGSTVEVPMMWQEASFDYLDDEVAQYVCLPYTSGQTIVFMLPKANITPEVALQGWLQKPVRAHTFSRETVDLTLPRVSIESTWPLREPLEAMGLGYLFTGELAGMDGILENTSFTISDTKQKARIEIFEEGTKAAAVTDIAVKDTAAMPTEPVELVFDRPFAFAVYDGEDSLELFRGVVYNPQP